MGISGLLPFLKKSSVNTNVSQFRGQTVAIDAYCWLHKGAFACADKLVKGEKTDVYVTYCMRYVNMLLSHNVRPILVFDGQPLPSKLVTEIKRKESRERNRMQAREHLRRGETAKARECFQKCVDVTSAMALELIRACRARHVDCIVAPYEADAQLAYLALNGVAYAIITEDSDLLAFGCPRVLFKMDQTGNGVLIEKDKLYLSLGDRADTFNDQKFRRMCILSGCDYLPSLPGIGLGKSFKFFSRQTANDNADINKMLCQLPASLKMASLEVSPDYRAQFVRAEQTFLHQLVYDARRRRLVPLTPYPDGGGDGGNPELDALAFAGRYLDDEVAFQLALGNLDVDTLRPMDDYHPDRDRNGIRPSATTRVSIWSRDEVDGVRQKESDGPRPTHAPSSSSLSKQTTTRVEFRLPELTATVTLQEDVTSQYVRHPTPTVPSPSTSPVLVSCSKRRRTDENVSPPPPPLPAVLDPFGGGSPSCDSRTSPATTHHPRLHPFAKLKRTSTTAADATAEPSISQVRTTDADGRHVVSSSYFFRREETNVDVKMAAVDETTVICRSPATRQPFKPVGTKIQSPAERPIGGSAAKRLSHSKSTGAMSNAGGGGLRQLDLRSMFAATSKQ